jgi:hypothetical protein
MTTLLGTLKGLFSIARTAEQDRDAAYLAESTDRRDLERRIRQLDTGRHRLYTSGPYGVFMR